MKPVGGIRLFVYGTLRRSFSNHERLENAPWLTAAATAPEYDVASVDGYPALVPGDRSVPGELYAATETLLERLDAFEGENYRRDTIRLADGTRAIAYVLASAPSCARDSDGKSP